MGKATVVAGPVQKAGLPTPQPADLLNLATGDITTTADTVLSAAIASNFQYLTELTIQNSHPTVGTWVVIKDVAAVRHSVYCAPGGGGAVIQFPENGPLRSALVNTAWNVACLTTGANVRVSATGFKATR
jgi:hypothetical protein